MSEPSVPPLPRRLLQFTSVDGELVPSWLGDRDRPWLRDLLALAAAADGRPFAALQRRLLGSDPDPRAGARQPLAREVLLAWLARRTRPDPRCRERRTALFEAAAHQSRGEALRVVAARFGCTADELQAGLFADLPGERLVRWPVPTPDPGTLALRTNLALVQGLLLFAARARLSLHGASRGLLRTAWLHTTGCTVAAIERDAVTLRWQRPGGPAGRRAARGLGALCGLLPWCRRYELRAHCVLADRHGDLVLTTGDPLLPGPEPRPFDSGLERRFAEEFARATTDWLLTREPVPLQVGDALAFPDFELRHRTTGRRFLLEIAGLRDPRALPGKLAALSQTDDLLLCLPARHLPDAWRGHPRIVPMRRRVPVDEVLRRLQLPDG